MTKGITAMGFSTGMYIQKEDQVQIGPREVELYVEAGVTLHMHYRPTNPDAHVGCKMQRHVTNEALTSFVTYIPQDFSHFLFSPNLNLPTPSVYLFV